MKRLTGISALSLAILIGWFVLSAGEDPSGKTLLEFTGKVIAAERSEILQLTTGGHVIGFRADRVIFASGDHAVQVEFIGANSVKLAAASDGESLEKVVYKELWDKIDLVYEKTSAGIVKSSYIVSPGGDPSNIRLRYNGKVAIAANDELVIEYKDGRMSESKPVAWQEKGDAQEPVTALFRKVSGNEIGFSISGWDRKSILIIDPVLEWNTFLGSNSSELCDHHSISADFLGNVYVCGYSGATWGSPVHAYTGYGDVFVAKIDNSGNLVWNTFLGGMEYDYDSGIIVDSTGNVLITGYSTATWGSPVRAYTESVDAFSEDAFVAKLDNNGNLLWNTFLGANADDRGSGIITDGPGNVFISGYSDATWGNPVRAYSGGTDAFAAKLDSSGNLIWNTFLGGISGEVEGGIAIDGTGDTFITGRCYATWGSPVREFSALSDIFVAKLNSTGDLLWNTFLGGNGNDDGYGIVVDSTGNAFISGSSSATWGNPVRAYSAGNDILVAKLDNDGKLLWNTFLGGSGGENNWGGIAIDATGNVFISGNSNATWGSPTRAYSGGWDAFAAKLSSSGSLLWNAFLGGSNLDNSYGIAVDATGRIYVSGYSLASWGTPVRGYSGGIDFFAAMFRLPIISGNTGTGGVTLSYNDGGAKTVTSDSSGNYSIVISDNWSGTITPVKNGYTFTPVSRTYSNVLIDQTSQNYMAFFVGLITVTVPNGGESWMVSTPHDITWTSSGTVGNVNIDYSTNSGTSWTSVATNEANDGSFTWTVPNTPSTACLVRIQEVDGDPSDTSNAVFSIVAYAIETVSTPDTPSGPATGIAGTSYTYSSGDAVSSLGHDLQYMFDWGDTTDSGWLEVGTTSASHYWLLDGTYDVRVMARCASHTAIESAWSTAFTVTQDKPTWVAISSFEANFASGEPTVEWHTAAEIGSVGFYLWRQDKENKKFELVNPDFLPCLPNSLQGGIYRLVDPDARYGETVVYRLEEINAHGDSLKYGPFKVTFADGPGKLQETDNLYKKNHDAIETHGRGFQRAAFAASKYEKNRQQARRNVLQTRRSLRATRGNGQARIAVKSQGLFRIDNASIAAALGISAAQAEGLIAFQQLCLSNMGEQVAWLADANRSGIYFYGENLQSPYSDENIYWLEKGRGRALETVNSGTAAPANTSQTFNTTSHYEESLYALTNLYSNPADDFWIWDYVMAGFDSKSFPIQVPGRAVAGTATLTVNLQGATDTAAANDHHVRVILNGTQIGESQWDGITAHSCQFSFDQSILNDGGNTIVVSGVLANDVPYSIFYIDSFDLNYQRNYQAVNNTLWCQGDANQTISVTGFSDAQVMVWDVSQPRRPKLVNTAAVDQNGRINFIPAAPANKYLLIGLSAVLQPFSVTAVSSAHLKRNNNSAEYLLIAPEEFANEARQLADYRHGQGLDAMVVTLEDIYNNFNYGLASPLAIKDFLNYAYAQWRGKGLKYVVLVGKGTHDYKNYLGYGDNLVPAIMANTPDGLFAADNLYGDIDGNDGIPEIAIGRLPVVSVEELQIVINKIKAYGSSQGTWTDKALLITDNADNGGDFLSTSENLSKLLNGYVIERISLLGEANAAESRLAIIAGFNAGTALVNYVGHAGLNQLAEENIFNISDLPLLQNNSSLPIMTLLTCVAGRFDIPGYVCLSEALLLKDNGGIVAALAPSGASFNSDAGLLFEELYQAVFSGKEKDLGTAWRKATKEYIQQGGKPYLLNIYNLLGDPAVMFK